MSRNYNRGVVLSMGDAAAIARWMQLVFFDKKFFNPIDAMEAEKGAIEGTARLVEKLANIYLANQRQR